MTSSNFNNQMLSAEPSEEKPVSVTPTSIEEIRARKSRLVSEPASDPPSPQESAESAEELADRVAELEDEVKRGRVDQQQIDDLAGQVQDLSARLNNLMSSLQGTVGFGARQSFICRNCQSRGQVAARLHCTSCGQENWWGWWPPRQ